MVFARFCGSAALYYSLVVALLIALVIALYIPRHSWSRQSRVTAGHSPAARGGPTAHTDAAAAVERCFRKRSDIVWSDFQMLAAATESEAAGG